MKNKLFIFAVILLIFVFPVFSSESIIDNAKLLNSDDKAHFETLIADIASAFNFELIILTENSIQGANPIDYSWNYLDSRGLDGHTWDGCLLLQAAGSREYSITASGRGSKILNSTAYDRLESAVLLCLKKNDYSGAYETFISIWNEYLVLESKNRSYNFVTHYYKYFLLGAWIISLLIGLLVVKKWKLDMNTALPKTEADNYIVPDSLNFTLKQDRFLYSTVSKTLRQKSSSSSGGGSFRSGGGRSSRSGRY